MEGGQFNYDIVRSFVNVTMYSHYNNKKFFKWNYFLVNCKKKKKGKDEAPEVKKR
jgi:hypothetical protein